MCDGGCVFFRIPEIPPFPHKKRWGVEPHLMVLVLAAPPELRKSNQLSCVSQTGKGSSRNHRRVKPHMIFNALNPIDRFDQDMQRLFFILRVDKAP